MNKEFLRAISGYIRPHYKWLLLTVISLVLSVLIEIIVGELTNRMIDGALASDKSSLFSIVIALVGTVLIGGMTTYMTSYGATRLTTSTIRDIRKVIVGKISKLPLVYTEKQKSGEIASKLSNDVGLMEDFMKNGLSNLLYQPLVFVAAFIYLLFVNWQMLLVNVIVIPTFMYAANYISKNIGTSTERYQQNMGEISASVKQTVDGIEVIHAYNLKSHMTEAFRERLTESLDLYLKIERRRSLLPGIGMVLQAVPYAITILYGGYLTLRQEITPGQLLVFIYLLKYLVRPPVTIPWLLSSLRQASAASGRVFALLDVPEEWSYHSPGTYALPDSCAVALERVTFQYDDGRPVLQDFQLQIEKNKMVAIVGPSGSGKSTLAKLMCGLYEPIEGTVSILGREFNRESYPLIREQISYVSQDTHLFPVTISKNIQYGQMRSGKTDIAAAAEAAYATEFIRELKSGFDTKVSENGGNLSGGQKQRLGLARALIKDSQIVIMDEPTSALDKISEEYFQNSIAELKGHRTIIVVAHRLPTITKADEIVVMDKGTIVSRGTHEQLLNNCGLYSQLYGSFT